MNKQFIWQVRVYYEDTDTAGVVYYANYLKFMERARTEWLRVLGFEQDVLLREHGIIFAVRSAYIDYLHPARFNDLLIVNCYIEKFQQVSLLFVQEIRNSQTNDYLLCTGKVKLVCLDALTWRPCPLPENLIKEIRGVV